MADTAQMLQYKDDITELTLSQEKLNISRGFEAVRSSAAGAVSSFVGTTRDVFEGRRVSSLEYEAFTEMALTEMRRVVTELRDRWDVQKVFIEHKLGHCPVGDVSIVIFISSSHRTEALAATQYAIDRLKETVPIWKKVQKLSVLTSTSSLLK